uniref:Trm112 family protein n=2 Tax=unclassified bacterial viruses TaxID=12333 RepID=A0AAU7J8I5_9VIRU
MSLLADRMIAEFRLGLIQRHIVCPVSGNVLDIRTSRFILDPDGLPHLPLDPEVARDIAAAIERGEPALKEGYTLEAAQ